MKNLIDKPVKVFIRITRNDKEPRERALLIAKDENGNVYTFGVEESYEFPIDLTVFDMKE